MTRPSQQARNLLADALARRGEVSKAAADSVRSGSYANVWINAALEAIDTGVRQGPDDDD